MAAVAHLRSTPIEPGRELALLAEDGVDVGAIVSFVGLARGLSSTGEPIDRLVLDHHPTLTEQSMRDIASEALTRFGVSRALVVHRFGAIKPGETIVFAAASSPHRRAAFEAADFLMDRLKTDAVFWKREEGPGIRRWIEPSAVDREDRQRWTDPCPE